MTKTTAATDSDKYFSGEYKYPTEVAADAIRHLAINPSLSDSDRRWAHQRIKVKLDNLHARVLPNDISARPGRERLYSFKGLIYLGTYLLVSEDARVTPQEACNDITETITLGFKFDTNGGTEKIITDFFVLRGGQSVKSEDGKISAPDVWGPFDREEIVSKIGLTIKGEKGLGALENGEALTLIPIGALIDRIRRSTDRFDKRQSTDA